MEKKSVTCKSTSALEPADLWLIIVPLQVFHSEYIDP